MKPCGSDVRAGDYGAFCQRDLSWFEVEYLFIDAVYEGWRQWGCNQGILCAGGLPRDGSKVLLHLALGSRKSHQDHLDFIRHMVRRGLQAPVLVTTDGAPGLIRAVTEVWGHRLGQRCLAHKTPNIRVTCLETLRWRSSDACAMSATPSPWRWPRNEQLRFLKTTTRGIQRR